jgi:hypothetical protein
MTNIGAIAKRLIDAGVDVELAIDVVGEAFSAGVHSAPFRRSPGAEASARYRAKHGRDDASCRVMPRDTKERSPTPPKENNIPPEEPIGSSAPASPRPSRGTRLPDDWQPPEALVEFGKSLGFTDASARAELERMADHFRGAPGQRGVKRDWVATGRNWLRTAAERKGVAPKAPSGSPTDSGSIRAGEPAWDAWRTFYRDSGRKASIKLMDEAADAGKPFPVPSAWPPNRTAA